MFVFSVAYDLGLFLLLGFKLGCCCIRVCKTADGPIRELVSLLRDRLSEKRFSGPAH